MKIEWFKEKTEGVISVYPYHLTLNVPMKPYLDAYEFVRVGLVENKKIVIQPVPPQEEDKIKAMGEALLRISHKPSYDRISSAMVCRGILGKLGIDAGDCPVRFTCFYEEGIGVIADTEGGRL